MVEVVVVGGRMNMILKIMKEVLVRLVKGNKGRRRMWGLMRE
jgi:hypothetical protein